MKSFLSVWLFAIVPFCCIVGCGGGEEAKVIQPGQSYQPTAEEQRMQKEMEATRK